MLIDQRPERIRATARISFLGQLADVDLAPALLALRARVPLVVAFPARREGRHSIEVVRVLGPPDRRTRDWALAAMVKRRPNLLLLDEPTNHLDLEMRRSLAIALQSYSGALVIVSHDRSLLAACADRILVVADGRAREFDGDLDDYRQLRLKEGRARDGEARVSRKDERRAAAAARGGLRQRLRPLEKQLAAIEARLAQLSREIGEIRSALADPSLYESPDQARVAELGRAEARLAEALASAEEDWLHASARLEALRDEAS
jgi:ATP-binding cassette subfamily F protein 3